MSRHLWGQIAAVVTLSFGPASMAVAEGRDPVGESARYEVDRSASRTSSMVQSGSLHATVMQALPDHEDGPSYDVKIDYDLRIRLLGNRRGSIGLLVPDEYFTPEFLQDLRVNGDYIGPQFKVRHLGFGTVRNMDGRVYENCDKILIYDVQMLASSPLLQLAAQLLIPEHLGSEASIEQIENLEITGFVQEGQPVIGAVKLDVKGKYQGINIKAGADYKAP